jgi:hypothetical protein
MAKRTQKIENPFSDAKTGAQNLKSEIIALQLVVDSLNASLNAIKANAISLKASLGNKSGNSLADQLAMNDAMAKAIELQKQEQAVKKAQQAQEAQLIKLYEKAERDKERRIAREIADNKRKEAQYNKEIAQAEKLAKKLEQEGQAYNRVNGWLKKLSDEHRNLAIKKELGGKLTADEIKRMATLEARIKKYDSALKAVDATQGKHQRNVGNYASHWDGLGNSVQQLTRELPAFANSMQTGFMAISNNLPIFFDEITRLREANIQLQASGEPTTSVFRSITRSIFSMTGMLGLAVTALTFLGPKLIEYFTNSEESAKKLQKERDHLKWLNEERKKSSQFIGSESASLVGYLIALKNSNNGSKERIELIDKINKQFGTTLKNLSDEKLFQDQVNQSIHNYINYQREAFRIRKNTDLLNLNLYKQDQLYQDINKSLGLTTAELDKISNKKGAFSFLANELKQGITPIQTISSELGITEKRAGQLVKRFNDLQKADEKAFDANRIKEGTIEKNNYLFGAVGAVNELVSGTEDLTLAEEARSSKTMQSLNSLENLVNRADQYGANIGRASSAMDDFNIISEKMTGKLDKNETSLNDNNITLENYIENLNSLSSIVKQISDIDKDFSIKILDETILAETENIRNKILAGEEYNRDAITDLYNQRYELQIGLLDDELAYKTKVNQEALDKDKRQSIAELNEKEKQLIEDINKSKWSEDQKAKDRLAVQASYQIELLKLESIYNERQKTVDAEKIKETKAYQVSVYELEKETRDKTNQLNKDINQDLSDALDLRLKEVTDYYTNEKLILLKSKNTKEEISKEEIINKRAELEEKIWLEKQAGKDSTDLQIQLAELNRSEKERQLEQEKKHYEKLVQFGKKSADELLNYQIKKSQEKQKIIDGEISDSEKQSDLLAQKASQGNLLAEESLKKQQEITNKYRDKRQREEEREQRLEQAKKFAEMATNITNSLIQKGGEPIGSAGKAIGLVGAIKALFGGGFFFGTDDTGNNSPVADGYGKITGFTHENEQVWSKKDRADVGFASREDLKKAFQFMNSPQMILGNIKTTTDTTHAPILKEQLAKLDEMSSKLDRIPNEFFSQEIVDGVLSAVHIKKSGNTTTKRYIGS